MFGEKVERYMIVVFMSADQLEGPIDDFIQGSDRLKNLLRKLTQHQRKLSITKDITQYVYSQEV